MKSKLSNLHTSFIWYKNSNKVLLWLNRWKLHWYAHFHEQVDILLIYDLNANHTDLSLIGAGVQKCTFVYEKKFTKESEACTECK